MTVRSFLFCYAMSYTNTQTPRTVLCVACGPRGRSVFSGTEKHEHSTDALHEQLCYMSFSLGQSCLMVNHEQWKLDNHNMAKAAARGLDSPMLMSCIHAWKRLTRWSGDRLIHCTIDALFALLLRTYLLSVLCFLASFAILFSSS